MNYFKVYNNLVESRKHRGIKKESGYEVHHILPRCLNGTNDKDNLVKLTYREHYVAHWLLIKIHPTNPKIYYGFLCMLRDPHGNRKLTSRMIETIKTNYVEFKKWHIKTSNPGRSENSRKAARNRMLSDENPMRKYPEKNPFLGKSYVIGKKWYNNGIKNLYLSPNEEVPEGYIPGMVYKKRKK